MSRFRPLIAAYLFLFFAHVADILSTYLAMHSGAIEMNIFARDPQHHAIFGHLLTLKLMYTVLYLLCSWLIYEVFEPLSDVLAIVIAACVPIYTTYDLLCVSITNLVVAANWLSR